MDLVGCTTGLSYSGHELYESSGILLGFGILLLVMFFSSSFNRLALCQGKAIIVWIHLPNLVICLVFQEEHL